MGARQLRAKALRRRVPLNYGKLRVARGGFRAKAPPLPARPKQWQIPSPCEHETQSW